MHSLRARLVLMVVSVVAITGIAAGLLFTRFSTAEFESLVESEQHERLESARTLLREHYAARSSWADAPALLDQIYRSSGRPPILITASGDVRVPPSSRMKNPRATREAGAVRIEWTSVQEGREAAGVLVFRGGDPIRVGGAAVGEVYLGPGEEASSEHSTRFAGSLSRSAVAAVALAGLIALALILTLSRRVLGPIERLTAAVRGMEGGRLDQRVEVRSRDEIGTLAEAFNEMAARLSRNERLRRDMVSDVAHELRTPLTNLRAQIESMQDGLLTVDRESLGSVHEEIVHLGGLIDDLQDLAAADAGQLTLEPADVSIEEELTRARNALEPLARAASVALRLEPVPPLPAARADARRLGQVLRNLVTNAIAHSPAGGAVTLAAAAGAGRVTITVTDRGAGIAAEHLPHVFDRFYRADPSRARATGGAGLGLAIVRQLVEAMGGAVRVESRLGEGSVFAFDLPVAGADPGSRFTTSS
jgi:signal transduction histidine kinase